MQSVTKGQCPKGQRHFISECQCSKFTSNNINFGAWNRYSLMPHWCPNAEMTQTNCISVTSPYPNIHPAQSHPNIHHNQMPSGVQPARAKPNFELSYILQPSNINLPKFNSPQWLQKGCVSSILAVNSICAGELLEEADILVWGFMSMTQRVPFPFSFDTNKLASYC